jgi:protein-S-isoprenylcysteine O-methyltransferase Ste14
LKASLDQSNKEKAALSEAVDGIRIFGTMYSKAWFVSVTGIVGAGLVVLSVMLFLMYRVAFGTSQESRKLNEALYKEFDDYKHQAVEKHIKLSRELQDYRNRLADLKSH